MELYEVIWKNRLVEKIERKHQVSIEEVEQVLFSTPHTRRTGRGRIKGEDLYVAYGQTLAGRYLVVFFVCKRQGAALPISARDMSAKERKYYERQKEAR
jgi:uncharacterized protein